MSARRRKQGPCWEQLPASVLGQVARHLRRPGRTAGTETICQVCSTCECHGMPCPVGPGAAAGPLAVEALGLLQAAVILPVDLLPLTQMLLM